MPSSVSPFWEITGMRIGGALMFYLGVTLFWGHQESVDFKV